MFYELYEERFSGSLDFDELLTKLKVWSEEGLEEWFAKELEEVGKLLNKSKSQLELEEYFDFQGFQIVDVEFV